jgi:hypothetical protein
VGAIRAVYKFGYLLEHPEYPAVLVHVTGRSQTECMSSDNPIGADNQQERLDDYLAGYVDGEGSFHVAVQRTLLQD